MAIALVASGKFNGNSVGGTTGAINASGANLGVLVAGYYSGVTSNISVTDSNGNTWTQRVHSTTPTPFAVDIWDCQGTFTNGMTVTIAGSNIFGSFGVAFYSGAASSAYGTGTSFAGSSHTSTIQPGSLTAPGNGYLYVAGVVLTDNQSGFPTINSGFTIEQNANWSSGATEGFSLADIIQGTAAALNPTWSGLNGTLENAAAQAYWAPAGGGGVTGSAAWTEGNDTWSGAGAVAISGAAAWTEGNDTWSGTGTLTSSGAAAWTEGNDVWAGAGTVTAGITGSVAWTEGNDIWAGSGAVAISGAAAWVEGNDIWAGTGTITLPPITGTVAWTEGNDAWSGLGNNGNIDTHDPGLRKRRKEAADRERQRIEDERLKTEQRRAKVRDVFERIVEGKQDVPEPVVEEIAAKVADVPTVDMTAAVMAFWDEYLEREDEEILVLI